MKYIVPENVFYRRYGDSSVVYDTEQKKVYLFNAIVKDILDGFSEYNDAEGCIDFLKKIYVLNDASSRDGINAFVAQLREKGILAKENRLSEEKNDLEQYYKTQVVPENQLCSAQFEVTFRCNEKCRHCYCVLDGQRKELTTDEIKKTLDDLRDMNVFDVTFTGGDLFVRQDIFEILEYAFQKRFLINIFTNGIALSDSDILRLKRLHLRSLHFSIYSHIPEKHDAFTRVSGSFYKTTEVIKKCVSVGIPVNIKTCLLNYNADETEEILKLAETLGTTAQVSFAVTPKNDGDIEPTQFRLDSPERYAEVMKKVNAHVEIHCSTDLKKIRDDNGEICGAGRASVNINPYGDVFPCNSLLMKCGNLREASIKEIWKNSEVLKEVRKFTLSRVEGCEGCSDLGYCNFCPGSALTETGSPLKRYSEACTLTKAKHILNKEETDA